MQLVLGKRKRKTQTKKLVALFLHSALMGDTDYMLFLQHLHYEDDNVVLQLLETQEEETEEEEEEEEEDEEDEEDVPVIEPPRVSQDAPSIPETSQNRVEEEGHKRRRTEGGEPCSSNGVGSVEGSQENEWNRTEIDGLFCPICMEAWTNDGDHHICCLPCGHIYGMSCINKWLHQRRSSGKCPQCNRKCTLKDVRKLFASRVVAVDEESQKKIRSLEAKCASHEMKDANWCKKEAEWRKREEELHDLSKKREDELHLKVGQLTERTTYLERLLGEMQSRLSGFVNAGGDCQGRPVGHSFGSQSCRQGSSCSFIFQKEFQVDGARLVDVDGPSEILLIARRQSGIAATSVLTKISLISPHEREDIYVPSSMKVIKDLHISPSNGSLALLASLGQKLSVLSLDSNNIILTYDLPAAAWSCSWDLNSSHYIYAGLQNGLLLVFDMRQTAGPVNCLRGLTCNPVHTVHSLLHNSTLPSGVRSVLTASSIGLCRWNFGGVEEGPCLVPETDNQGVCISLSYSPSSDDIVASYRPKLGVSSEMAVSQSPTAPSNVIGQGIRGSHVNYKGLGSNRFQKLGSACANVNGIRLPNKSAIIDIGNQNQLFASADEVTSELVLQELPSFTDLQRFKSQKDPIRDMKYTNALSQGLLSCLRDDALQLFCTKLS